MSWIAFAADLSHWQMQEVWARGSKHFSSPMFVRRGQLNLTIGCLFFIQPAQRRWMEKSPVTQALYSDSCTCPNTLTSGCSHWTVFQSVDRLLSSRDGHTFWNSFGSCWTSKISDECTATLKSVAKLSKFRQGVHKYMLLLHLVYIFLLLNAYKHT